MNTEPTVEQLGLVDAPDLANRMLTAFDRQKAQINKLGDEIDRRIPKPE